MDLTGSKIVFERRTSWFWHRPPCPLLPSTPTPIPDAGNSFDQPDAVKPQISTFAGVAPEFTSALQPYSLTSLRIPEK
jgi:hypothetical protein